MANIVEFGARTNVRGGERGTVHGAVASDFDIIVNLDVAEMTDFSRAPVGAYGIAEAVAADGGVRMNLAILADLAVESHEHLGMYDRTRTDTGAAFDDGMRPDQATFADHGAGSDDAIGPQMRSFADLRFRMHHGGRVPFAPLF